jgi:release factor glutamine methyltransferase
VTFEPKSTPNKTMSSIHPLHHLHELYQWIQSQLAVLSLSKEQQSAEANWLLEHAFGTKAGKLLAQFDEVLETDDPRLQQIQAWVKERIEKRTPLQYCLNEAWFYGRPFYVSPAVLIPRPETELLVEWAWAEIQARNWTTVMDIGTGSGCIAISLVRLAQQHHYPLQVWATDISEDALSVAKQNAEKHETAIHWIQGDGLTAVVLNKLDLKKFDLIVSNPPYINPAQLDTLAPEVREHEPHQALFAENEGLSFYQQFAHGAAHYLNPDGGLMCEIGAEMGTTVKGLFEAPAWRDVQVRQDYAQHDRLLFAVAVKTP